jgi:Flp pilus assembly protein TadD
MKTGIRLRDNAGRSRQLSLEEALDEASRNVAAGEYTKALVLLEKAVRAAPFDARARYLLGQSQANTDSPEDATYNLKKAVEGDPNNSAYRASLARALMPVNPSEAVPHFLAAIQLGSSSVDVFAGLASILLDLHREEDVLKVCDLGLLACQDHFALLGNRSVALVRLGLLDEALTYCRSQLDLQPGDERVWGNMGGILRELGRLQEAEEALRHACLLAPQNARAHYNLALVLLLAGKYREGFREYEWRWQGAAMQDRQPDFVQPMWDGSFLNQEHILLHAEQGLGDTIQFVRYLPLVAHSGGRIVLQVQPSLVRLIGWLQGGHQVANSVLPAGGFASHCPLLSLPLVFGTELDSIPPPASFVIPAAIRESWAHRTASDKPKVALVWAGSPAQEDDRRRSLPLRALRPLTDVSTLDFFSLQVGAPALQLKTEGLIDRIRDLSPFLTDFAETAAALSCMALVISVDTSVAHLAGTLGKPVWMLTRFAPDWRWQMSRDDSPWYPSMRLFRQQTPGDWEPVVRDILAALRHQLASQLL